MEIAFGVLSGLVLGAVLLYLWQRRTTSNEAAIDKSTIETQQRLQLMQEQMEKLSKTLDTRLDSTHAHLRDSMVKQFNHSSRLIADVSSRLAKLDETNKQVMGVTDELRMLQTTLQNPKQRGVLGEYHLESVLKNILPPGRYEMQKGLGDGLIVDAVIFLDGDKMLPIDSKFSLENYNRLINAKDKADRERLENEFKKDLKLRIDETSKYIRPQDNTMDFAFMFIPSEAIYYDLLVNKVGAVKTSARDLIEYAFRDKQVIIVSPTSFMAYLQTVLQGLRSLQIEEQAREIQQRVGELGRHIQSHETFMQKLGKSLGVTVGHYNNAHKELNKIDKDVTKISGRKKTVEPLTLDRPHED